MPQWQAVHITLVEKVQIIAVFLGSLFLVASISWLLWSALSPEAIWQRRDVLFQICYGMYGFMDLVCIGEDGKHVCIGLLSRQRWLSGGDGWCSPSGLVVHEGAAVYSVFLRWRAVNLHWDVQSYDKAKDMEEASSGHAALAPRTLWLPLVSSGPDGSLQATQLRRRSWSRLCWGPICPRLLPRSDAGLDDGSGEVVICVTSV